METKLLTSHAGTDVEIALAGAGVALCFAVPGNFYPSLARAVSIRNGTWRE